MKQDTRQRRGEEDSVRERRHEDRRNRGVCIGGRGIGRGRGRGRGTNGDIDGRCTKDKRGEPSAPGPQQDAGYEPREDKKATSGKLMFEGEDEPHSFSDSFPGERIGWGIIIFCPRFERQRIQASRDAQQ